MQRRSTPTAYIEKEREREGGREERGESRDQREAMPAALIETHHDGCVGAPAFWGSFTDVAVSVDGPSPATHSYNAICVQIPVSTLRTLSLLPAVHTSLATTQLECPKPLSRQPLFGRRTVHTYRACGALDVPVGLPILSLYDGVPDKTSMGHSPPFHWYPVLSRPGAP
jgi:hypothetical protein